MPTKNSTENAYRRERPNIKPSWIETRATLSPRESTRLTGFGLTATYQMLRAGKLPSIVVGKKYYIPKVALQRWLDACGSTITAA